MYLDKIAAEGKALGVLSDDEVKLLEKAEIGRLKSINVDDFDAQELKAQRLDQAQNSEQAA
jgi:acyl-CoA dehydrogenase